MGGLVGRRAQRPHARGSSGHPGQVGRAAAARDRRNGSDGDRRLSHAGARRRRPLRALRPRSARCAPNTPAPPARTGDATGAGRDHRRHGQSPAARRGGLHHVVQLPNGQHGGQSGAGAGRRQHRRGEAGAAGSAGHRGARPHPQRRRFPPGCGQPGQRQRSGLLRSIGGFRRGGLRQLHGLDPGRGEDRRAGGPHHEAHAARARRQGCLRRLRGRGREGRHRLHRLDLVLPFRADLHRADTGRGAPQRVRSSARRARSNGGLPQGGRSDRHRHHHRAGDLGGAAGTH